MPQSIIQLLVEGAEANRSDRFRKGNVIELPGEGEVVLTGDIHGHRRNFERIVNFCDLASHPERHVVLQEVIHGGPADEAGGCLSYKLLFEAVRYKIRFPGQVHFLMSNHDTAFITSNEVMKDGRRMNESMVGALGREFGGRGGDVGKAISEYLFSQALGVRCENGVWASHSLPNDRHMDVFDMEIFERAVERADLESPGSVYLLLWGRRQSEESLAELASMLGVSTFVVGHQPQPEGYARAGKNLLIINSEHNHGCILPIGLGRSYSVDELIECIVPLASIA